MNLTVASSPHIRGNFRTSRLMLDVVLALLPALVVGAFVLGFRALLVALISVAAAVTTELCYSWVLKKRNTVIDCSAIVTGLLFAMTLPVSVPYWIAVGGSAFAILVAKLMFGGLGQNIFNPALLARAAVMVLFPASLTRYPALGVDAVTSATPLHHMVMPALPEESILDMFLGNCPGSIGEISALALILGGVYLVVRKVISIRTPLAYIGTVAVLTLVFASVGVASFLTAAVLLVCIFRYNFCKNEAGDRGTAGLIRMGACRFLSVLLGAAGAYDIYADSISIFRYAVPLIFATGVFLYIYGLSRSAQSETELLPERPGYRIFLSGAIISYATLFALVIQKPTDNWYELVCGGISALSAAVFLVLAYWCFRLFHYPILPRQVQKSIGLLIFGLIFLQAAAIAAASVLWMALAFLAAAVLSRFAAKAFYGS